MSKAFDLISYNQSEEFNKNTNADADVFPEEISADMFITVLATYFLLFVDNHTVEEIQEFTQKSKEIAEEIISVADLLRECREEDSSEEDKKN